MEGGEQPNASDCTAQCPLFELDGSCSCDDDESPFLPLHDLGFSQEERGAELYSPIMDWQTRMLKVHPGSLGQPLTADLVTVDIILDEGVVDHVREEKLTYEALSYCWGVLLFGRNVTVNGIEYPITENLYRALQRIRLEDRSRCLWIDALCINQYDVEERSAQRGDCALSGVLLITLNKKRSWVDTGDDDARDRDEAGVKRVANDCCNSHRHLLYDSLKQLFDRPWYTRVWVRQEIWAARNIVVHCGRFTLQWDGVVSLSTLANILAQHLGSDLDPRSSLQTLLKGLGKAPAIALAAVERPELADSFRSRVGMSGSPVDLFNVMQASSECQCSESRDRVYAVPGMAIVDTTDGNEADAKAEALVIDYSRSTAQVFQDAAHYMMISDGSYSLLGIRGTFGGTVEGGRLPSWCPDWSKPFRQGSHTASNFMRPNHDNRIQFKGAILQIMAYCSGAILSPALETVEYVGERWRLLQITGMTKGKKISMCWQRGGGRLGSLSHRSGLGSSSCHTKQRRRPVHSSRDDHCPVGNTVSGE